MKKLLALGLLLSMWAVPFQARSQETRDVVDTMMSVQRFDTFLSLLREADLTFTLKQSGPYTILAPTDEAFSRIPDSEILALRSNMRTLRSFILDHVIRGSRTTANLMQRHQMKTMSGGTVLFQNMGGRGTLNGAGHFVVPNVMCSNGIVQGIDTVAVYIPLK